MSEATILDLQRRLIAAAESLETIGLIAQDFPELNMSNYSEGDVAELNGAMVGVLEIVDAWREAYSADSKAARESLA